MLFNSYVFILIFLPVALLIFSFTRRVLSLQIAIGSVVVASLVYYAYWRAEYLVLLIGSVVVNYAMGRIVMARRVPMLWARRTGWQISDGTARLLTFGGVVFNLALLGYYKYAGFFVTNMNDAFGFGLSVPATVLPIGISFFTFQQIAFLVDAYKNAVSDRNGLHYAFFVTFFPQLIAGPIVHHSDVIPQLSRLGERDRRTDFAVGLAIFVVGLAKKVVIADSLAVYADSGYGALSAGATLSLASAWVTVLAYSFQLYFDFSGYSDMAVGLARLFGVRLPVNFYSPYKATGIVDFWRRWHITLSRFLRDYLYVPLGGNRRGLSRRVWNVGLVMVLGGLWHGAGWTFVIWGLAHGAMIAVNQLWNLTAASRHPLLFTTVGRMMCVTVTFLGVTLAWVPFRSADLAQAIQMFHLLFPVTAEGGALWTSLADFLITHFGSVSALIDITAWAPERELWPVTLPPDYIAGARPAGLVLVGAALIAFLAPNTYQLFGRFQPALGLERLPHTSKGAIRRLNLGMAIIFGALFALSLLMMQRVSPFLYFQF